MKHSVELRFVIPVLSALPVMMMACTDSADTNPDADVDALSDDTSGADGTTGGPDSTEPDTTEPDTGTPDTEDDSTAPDTDDSDVPTDADDSVLSTGDVDDDTDTVETDGSAESDGSAETDTTVDDDTDVTDPDTDVEVDADVTIDTDTDDADTTEPDADADTELTPYEEFFASLDPTALNIFCSESVDCGVYDDVASCTSDQLDNLANNFNNVYDDASDIDTCLPAMIAYVNCALSETECLDYEGEPYVRPGFLGCYDEYYAFYTDCDLY